MTSLRYLTADVALTLDDDAVLEAAASTRQAEHADVLAEVEQLLAWCRARHPHGHAPREEGGDWHHELQVVIEPGGWHRVHLTLTGNAAFIDALVQAFFALQGD